MGVSLELFQSYIFLGRLGEVTVIQRLLRGFSILCESSMIRELEMSM